MSIEELERMPEKTRQVYLDIIRSIPPGRKFEIAAELCDAVRQMIIDVYRSQNPDATEEEIRRELIKRTLPEDLRRKVYGF